MLSGYLAVLLLQLAPTALGSTEAIALQHRAAEPNGEYDRLQGLVASARSTAVDLLHGSNGTCTLANVETRREW